MKTFHCTHCDNLVFFENVQCLQCQHRLAYVPERQQMVALEEAGEGRWREAANGAGATLQLCANYLQHHACNWALPADDATLLCLSCRLTRTTPPLDDAVHRQAWVRFEAAKRRLVYTLHALRLPLVPKSESSPEGVCFDFLADLSGPSGDGSRVVTGHDNGVITVNVAEADDVYRERQRHALGEPYRTPLGHLRHEVGHYYWDRLVRDSPRLQAFRALFGDERRDYGEALQRHYQEGAPADWPERFISAYASMHPWEDWAESWAHFMHMYDALESARSMGVTVRPGKADEPAVRRIALGEFAPMIEAWLALTYMLNNLARGLGEKDSYPFVLSTAVVDKLRFVHQILADADPDGGANCLLGPQAPAAATRQVPLTAPPLAG